MDIAITGATGFIGSALARALRGEGHRVLRLVRRAARDPDEIAWSPGQKVDTAALEGADAVVHLAGAGIGDRRWTESYKKEIRDSRVDGTRTLATALAQMERKPAVLLSASGINWYGDTGDHEVDESAPSGEGFLAELARDWEAAAAPAGEAGVRVTLLRSGPVLAPEAPLVGRVLPLFKLGLGGRFGPGRQWMSWISLPDYLAAMRFLLEHHEMSGPVNLTAPNPVTNVDYTKALGRAVHRPAPFVVPAFALRVGLGEFADEGVLISLRVAPRRLTEAGFSFRYPDIDAALAALITPSITPSEPTSL